MSWISSLMRKSKKCIAVVGAVFLTFLATATYGASIYNSDFEAQRVKIENKDGSHYFVTVYNSSTHYFDCIDGCLVTLVRTGYTRTVDANSVVIIDDGKLRVK